MKYSSVCLYTCVKVWPGVMFYIVNFWKPNGIQCLNSLTIDQRKYLPNND